MSSSPNKVAAVQVSEALKGLTQEFFAARERCAADSFLLLQANQRFLKKLGDLKKVKDDVEIERNNFVDKATVYALRDAELRYQKACFLETEQEWADMIRSRHEEIKLLRSALQEQLAHYCEERRKTSVLQGQVTQRTEEDRINALNSVAFCTYSQNIVEQEIKKLCATAVLPTQRNLQKTQQLLQQALQSVRKDTQQFHEEKIKEFKRQERILFGRGRDASDLQPQQQGRVLRSAEGASATGATGDNANTNNNPNTTNVDLMIDSLENRIALRLLSQTVAFDAHATTMHDEDDAHNHNQEEHDDYHRHAASPGGYHPTGGPNALIASLPSYSMSRTGGTDGGGLADSGAFSITNNSLSNNHYHNSNNNNNSSGNAHTRGSSSHHHAHNNASHSQHHSAYARRSLRSTTYSQSSSSPQQQPQQRSRPSRRFSLLQNGDLMLQGPQQQQSQPLSPNQQARSQSPQQQQQQQQQQAGWDTHDFSAQLPHLSKRLTHYSNNSHNNHDSHNTGNNSPGKSDVGSNEHPRTGAMSQSKAPSNKSNSKQHNGKGTNANSNQSEVIFDRNWYAAACAPDYLRPHCLLDIAATSVVSADREARLINLGRLTCEARGKVQQMQAVKASLDGLLVREIALLLTLLDDGTSMHPQNQQHVSGGRPLPHNTKPPSLKNPNDKNHNHHTATESGSRSSGRKHKHRVVDPASATASRPLHLSAQHKITQLDCAQKEQDLVVLRHRIFALLQEPSLHPTSAAGGPRPVVTQSSSPPSIPMRAEMKLDDTR